MGKTYSTVLYWFEEDANTMREFARLPENHQKIRKLYSKVLLNYAKKELEKKANK